MTPAETEGRRLVAELVRRGGVAELARQLGVSEGMVRHVATGRKRPGPATAAKLAEHGVPLEAWTIAAAVARPAKATMATKAGKPTKVPAAPDGPRLRDEGGSVEALAALVRDLDGELEAARAQRASPSALAALYRVKEGALSRLAKLRGEGDLTEAQILRSHAFRRVMAAVARALRDHPAAAKALAQELQTIQATGEW